MQAKGWMPLLSLVLSLGCCLSPGASLFAKDQVIYPHAPNCPAPVVIPHCPPGAPHVVPQPAPQPETKPPETTPPETPQPEVPEPQPEEPLPTVDTTSAFTPETGGDLLAVADTVGMTGRADSANRFNLFDGMSAIPQTRVWFGFQAVENFDSNLRSFDTSFTNLSTNFARTNNQLLYRVGAEVALFKRFSIAAQTQYIDTRAPGGRDAFSQPQIMAKFAAVYTDSTVISAIFGVSPNVSTSPEEFVETDPRYFPGLLVYRTLTEDLFVQGGAQLAISQRDLPNTVDYAMSLGYWLYRDRPACRGCGDCGGCYDSEWGCHSPYCSTGLVHGVVTQLELFGKHVLANRNELPYELGTDDALSVEPKHVIDITAGTQVLFNGGLYLTLGFSVPVTGGNVRNAEFIANMGYAF
jgi:hypothetical protein